MLTIRNFISLSAKVIHIILNIDGGTLPVVSNDRTIDGGTYPFTTTENVIDGGRVE